MRAVCVTALGGVENLVDATLPAPQPASHEVVIRVQAVAFNPIDFQLRQEGASTLELPATLGFDVSGTIETVGAAVDSFAPGDEVIAYLGGPSRAGGYAEYVAIPHWFIAPKPTSLSHSHAASVPLAGLTASQSLARANAGAGRSVFVAGGAGGVGSWAIQIARARGCIDLVTTAGSAASCDYLVDTLGVAPDQVVMYPGRSRAELARAVVEAHGGSLFDVALDCVGGAMTNLCCDVVAVEGDVISIVNGPRDGTQDISISDEDVLFNKSAAFHFELVFAIAESAALERQLVYARQLRELVALIDDGAIRLPGVTILGRLSAAVVREAHLLLESGHTKGKLVAVVE